MFELSQGGLSSRFCWALKSVLSVQLANPTQTIGKIVSCYVSTHLVCAYIYLWPVMSYLLLLYMIVKVVVCVHM